MNTDQNAPRLLGAAFLFVFVTSLLSGLLIAPMVEAENISSALINLSSHTLQARLSLLGWMITSAGVIVLAVLLFIVLRPHNRLLALIALGLWLGEAITLPIALLGLAGLIPLSQEFVRVGAPLNSYYQTFGEFLYSGVYHLGMTAHMWFYCLGGLVWYGLFFRSHSIPRLISLCGVFAVCLSLGGMVFALMGYTVPLWVSLPIAPFELAIGLWLLIKGVRQGVRPPAYQPAAIEFSKA